jgi:hypothetical protein
VEPVHSYSHLKDPLQPFEVAWNHIPGVNCGSVIFQHVRRNSKLNLDPDWLAKRGMIEMLGKSVVFGDNVLVDFEEEIPTSQVAEWLGQNALARSFVSHTLAAIISNSGSKLCATWDAIADVCRLKPFVIKELATGDHITGAVGITSLPTMEECAGIMSSWPHALTGACKCEDNAMFNVLFSQIARDCSSLIKNCKHRMCEEEKKRPLSAKYAGESDDASLEIQAWLATSLGAAVDKVDWEKARKDRDHILYRLSATSTQLFSLQMDG